MKRGPKPEDPMVRVWRHIRRVRGCWLWTGATVRGYPKFTLRGKRKRYVYVHRWLYEKTYGPIPRGMHLDHKCRQTRCVRPLHLEPVTQRENNRRALIRAKRCPTCGNLVRRRVQWSTCAFVSKVRR